MIKLFGYILLIIFLLIVLIGWILPKERTFTQQTIFNEQPKIVYEIVTNNNDWKYRSDVKNLIITNNENGIETWTEIAQNGSSIHFKTIEKKCYSYYSFEMKNSIMTGNWEAEFREVDNNQTLFIATEKIKISNPVFRIISYLLFDVEKLMKIYQNDLKNKITYTKYFKR